MYYSSRTMFFHFNAEFVYEYEYIIYSFDFRNMQRAILLMIKNKNNT